MKKRWAILRWVSTAALAATLGVCLATRYVEVYVTDRTYVSEQLVSTFHRQIGFVLWVDGRDRDWQIRVQEARNWHIDWRFRFHRDRWGHCYSVDIPLWFPTLLFGTSSSALWYAYFRARRAAKLNLCPTCNYSLTGLPAGSGCPECGGGGKSGSPGGAAGGTAERGA